MPQRPERAEPSEGGRMSEHGLPMPFEFWENPDFVFKNKKGKRDRAAKDEQSLKQALMAGTDDYTLHVLFETLVEGGAF